MTGEIEVFSTVESVAIRHSWQKVRNREEQVFVIIYKPIADQIGYFIFILLPTYVLNTEPPARCEMR